MNQGHAAAHAHTEILLNKALADVSHLRAVPHEGDFSGKKRALDIALLKAAATHVGLTTNDLSNYYVLLEADGRALTFHQHTSSALLQLDRAATNEKGLTKKILQAGNIPVSAGTEISKEVEISEALDRIPGPWVAKPTVGTGGRGVILGLETEQQVLDAVRGLFTAGSRRVLIEEMIFGVDLRVAVLDGEAVGAALRIPANVIGDGVSSIRELVRAKDKIRSQSDYLRHQRLELTEAAVASLTERGYAATSVPNAGERVFLHFVANVSSGGDSYEVLDLLHPDLAELAVRAARLFPSSSHAGVDILAESFDNALTEQRAVVCEVNLNNVLPLHAYPAFGKPSPVALRTVQKHWKQEATPKQASAQLPIAPASVTAAELTQVVVEEKPHSNPHGILTLSKYSRTVPDTVLSTWRLERRLLRRATNEALAGAGKVHGVINLSNGLIEFSDGARRYCADFTGRTAHSAVNARDVLALRNVARLAGVPTTEVLVVDAADFASAADSVGTGGTWQLHYVKDGSRKSTDVTGILELAAVWADSEASGTVYLVRKPDTVTCTLLMREDDVLASQLTTPLTVFGKNNMTVAELVMLEAENRRKNPYLNLASTKTLRHYESSVGSVNQRLANMQTLKLSNSVAIHAGADTVNLTDLAWPSLQEMGSRMSRLIGNTGLGQYEFAAVPNGEGFVWKLHGYAAAPGLARYAFPRYGKPVDVYTSVAEAMLVGPRRQLR